MGLAELTPDFQRAIRNELMGGEEVLWFAQPDPNAVSRALLPGSLLWLTGLFLMSAGMLLHAPGDTQRLVHGYIFLLVLFGLLAVFELIFVPRRAARTVYVATDQRIMSICVTKKLNVDASNDERRILKQDHSTAAAFYFWSLPQLLIVFAAFNVVQALSHRLDWFIAVGFGLILTSWMLPWINEMRMPLAKFREAPRVLYSMHDMFIVMHSLPRTVLVRVKLRRLSKELFNAIIVSKDEGCLRLMCIPSRDKSVQLAELLAAKPVSENQI